jgi:hypothetical protein
MHHVTPSDGQTREQLLEQIRYFETRLEEMGWSGDCAYEKSLTRVYEARLGERRLLLQNLKT